MRRILLPILVIGVLLFGACGAPPVEAPPTPPPPVTEPEEPPDYTPWIASQLKDLNQAIINLISLNSNYNIVTRVYDEEQGEVLVHEFTVPAGAGGLFGTFPVSAFYFQEAKTHINNAYWLTNKSKLPDEVKERDVSTDEVAKEVSEALSLLKQQVSSSYDWQEYDIEWIKESPGPSPTLPQELQPNKEMTIGYLSRVYDNYREELSKMISELELILSRLTSTTSPES
jgi:hypothetical protein